MSLHLASVRRCQPLSRRFGKGRQARRAWRIVRRQEDGTFGPMAARGPIAIPRAELSETDRLATQYANAKSDEAREKFKDAPGPLVRRYLARMREVWLGVAKGARIRRCEHRLSVEVVTKTGSYVKQGLPCDGRLKYNTQVEALVCQACGRTA